MLNFVGHLRLIGIWMCILSLAVCGYFYRYVTCVRAVSMSLCLKIRQLVCILSISAKCILVMCVLAHKLTV